MLTDGGVYDNLGLETCWKRYDTIFVSDAGENFEPEPKPHRDWALQTFRVLMLINSQVRALRVRQCIDAFDTKTKKGTYWGTRTDIASFGLADAFQVPHARSLEIATIPTRLEALDASLQERTINWGYAIADASLRRYVVEDAAAPTALPYPKTGI